MSGTQNEAHDDERARTRAVTYLVVGTECDRPSAGGARFALEGVACATIGRGDVRSVRRREDTSGTVLHLTLPAPALSVAHARLIRSGNEWLLEDQGSTNGTFVNGTRVSRAVVGPRDVITVGRTVLFVSDPRLTPAGAPLDVDGSTMIPPRERSTIDPQVDEQLGALARVARSEVPVLVRGESGSGKEALARLVHERSERAGSFVALNCGAIPAGLVESHFFGHVKGAFSGADRAEPGFFRSADGGTLFLDEVGDLPLASQASLLRALQEREVTPVGSARPIKVDVRIVAASHRAIEAMVEEGTFRRDLFARLSGFMLELPPLRERRIDLGLILGSLLHRLAPGAAPGVRMSAGAAEAIFRYDWPLNIRELEQCLASALALAGDAFIDVSDLPRAVVEGARHERPTATPGPAGLAPRDAKLRLALLEHLAHHRGNLADVAREMGKARMQIHRWCKRFGIDPNLYRE